MLSDSGSVGAGADGTKEAVSLFPLLFVPETPEFDPTVDCHDFLRVESFVVERVPNVDMLYDPRTKRSLFLN